MKPFKTLDEQINILKERNLTFNDENEAKRYLLNNNYYNIINCYSKYFLDCDERYIDGTSFDDIMAVHHFDKNIKMILFQFIIECEKTFKSIFAYRYSEYFMRDNIYKKYCYLDINNYDSEKILKVSKNISQLSNIISSKINDGNNSISHYVRKHSDVPMWVLINNLTFGQTSKLYSFMPLSLKNIVSKDLSVFLKVNSACEDALLQPDELESYLINIVELRNLIAHNNKVMDHRFIKNNKYNYYLHSIYDIGPKSPRRDIFNAFVTMQCFLSHEEFAQLNNSILKRINKLKKKINSESVEKILSDLGFNTNLQKIEQQLNK